MHEKVAQYLEEKRSAEEAKKTAEKKNLLFSLGLYDKVYSDTTDGGFKRYDSSNGKYYKNIVADVTDEEYEEIKKYALQGQPVREEVESNGVATALKVIAIVVCIIGFLAGIAFVETFIITLACWIGTFISGMMFLGFAEIIKLLHSINNKIK